jgi:hypothetical protein
MERLLRQAIPVVVEQVFVPLSRALEFFMEAVVAAVPDNLPVLAVLGLPVAATALPKQRQMERLALQTPAVVAGAVHQAPHHMQTEKQAAPVL